MANSQSRISSEIKPSSPSLGSTSLSIKDYFLTIVEETPNDYVFDVAFSIDQDEVKEKNIRILNLIVSTNQQQTVIAKKDFDLFSILNNNETLKVSIQPIGSTLASVPGVSVSNLSLKEKNISILNMLKVDPSYAIFDQEYLKYSVVNELKNYYLYYGLSSTSAQVNYRQITESVRLKVVNSSFRLSIPKASLKVFGDYNFSFNLYQDENREFLFKPVKKKHNIKNYLNSIKLIKVPPQIGAVHGTNKGLTGLAVVQKDALAGQLEVKKKTINSFGQVNGYFSLSKLQILKDFKSIISENNSDSELQLYRCISSNSQVNYSSYSSIVAGTSIKFDSTAMYILDDKASVRVNIEINGIPSDVNKLEIYKRKVFPSLTDNVILAVVDNPQNSSARVADEGIIPDEIYEYSLTLISRGLKTRSITQLHSYAKPSTLINAQIISAEYGTSNGKPSATLNSSVSFLSEESDVIKRALEQSGIYQNFQNEFNEYKDNLSSLIFYKVFRTNISTGFKEMFNQTFVGPTITFVDNDESRRISNVEELDLSNSYVYEIRAYVKKPSTLLKSRIIRSEYVEIKAASGIKSYKRKPYAYKPYKWIQDNVRKSGTMAAVDSSGNNLTINSAFDDGDIGVVASISTNGSKFFLGVDMPNRIRADKNTVILSWSTKLPLDEYDHFVVVKEVNQKRNLLKSVITTTTTDEVGINDSGTVIYYVYPVFKDFSVGSPLQFESLLVEPEDFQS